MIDMVALNEVVSGITLTKLCSISPDKDSDESKKINLKVNFNGVSLKSVFTKAMASTVVTWQNGVGRKKFMSWIDGQTVEVDFVAPASQPVIEPEVAIAAKARAMSKEKRKAYLEKLAADLAELDEPEDE